MRKLPWTTYLVILVTAFGAGLVATVAATHFIGDALAAENAPAFEQPAGPADATALPVRITEC